MTTDRALLALAPLLAALVTGCAGSDRPSSNDGVHSDEDAISSIGGDISPGEMLARAQKWVDMQVMYSQDQSNPAPDGDGHAYRPDCSGMVSMAWHLQKKSDGWDFNTNDFGSSDLVHTLGSYDDLQPGDALNSVSYGHIVLFDRWIDDGHTQMWIYQESDFGTPAEHVQRGTSWYHSNGFDPIRYVHVTAGGDDGTKNGGGVGPEGSQAFVSPGQQHFVNRDGNGNVRHHFWDATQNAVISDTWGSGAAGTPVSFVDGTSQHVFARGGDGSLLHWYWDPAHQNGSDTWGGGLAGDPAAIMIGEFQDVWAVDGGGSLQHWWWGPNSGGVQHDTWGAGVTGRPSVLVTPSGEQHAFARGTGGTLEHFWWAPGANIQHDTWGQGLAGDPAALAIGEFQDVWAVDGGGTLQHWYWGPSTGGMKQDAWGTGVVGRPSVALYGNGDQEVFVRGTGGALEHFWWDSGLGISHDTWGQGITSDPTAAMIDAQQHVWATDAGGHAQHWFWDPGTGLHHDDWGQ